MKICNCRKKLPKLCSGGKVKKLLAILVLGLLLSSNAYTADCNQASGAITGTSGSPDTTEYVCETDDIFILDAEVYNLSLIHI